MRKKKKKGEAQRIGTCLRKKNKKREAQRARRGCSKKKKTTGYLLNIMHVPNFLQDVSDVILGTWGSGTVTPDVLHKNSVE